MNTDSIVITPAPSRIRGTVIVFMSLAAAIGTSTLYPLQPAIAEVAHSFDAPMATVGMALAAGPIGYLVGLCLLVPLVDRYPPGRVLAAQFAVLAVGLAASAAVGTVAALGAVTGMIGACSAVGAGLSSVVGHLAPPRRRAAMLGVVTAGISAGILAGRIAGGLLSEEIGWRAMLRVFAGACALIAVCCLMVLPADAGGGRRGYLATVRSLPGLVVRNATLRVAAFSGAFWFFAFCTVWAGLAVALSEPPYSYSADRIGLFALAGLSGIVVTPLAGSLTDRLGARRVMAAGLALAGSAAAIAAVGLGNTVVTLICLAVFDAGLFAAQVANQSIVLSIDPVAPARFNSAYLAVYFIGGSLGTACGAAAVDGFGWPATATAATSAIAVAGAIALFGRRISSSIPPAPEG